MEIGRALKEAREAMGLSLERIEEETKIRKKFIRAMEEENFDQLPGGPVYVKAFLRSYARFLNLPADKLLDGFTGECAGQSSGKPPGVEVARHEQIELGAKSYPWQRMKPDRSTGAKSATGRMARVYAAAAVALAGIILSSYLAAGGLGLKNKPGKPEARSGATPPLTAVNEQGPLTHANEKALRLLLSVTNTRSWMLVEVDGTVAFQGELAAGQSKNFEAKEKIWVKIGNAGAVEVNLNGKNLGYLDGQGIVVEREFDATGG